MKALQQQSQSKIMTSHASNLNVTPQQQIQQRGIY